MTRGSRHPATGGSDRARRVSATFVRCVVIGGAATALGAGVAAVLLDDRALVRSAAVAAALAAVAALQMRTAAPDIVIVLTAAIALIGAGHIWFDYGSEIVHHSAIPLASVIALFFATSRQAAGVLIIVGTVLATDIAVEWSDSMGLTRDELTGALSTAGLVALGAWFVGLMKTIIRDRDERVREISDAVPVGIYRTTLDGRVEEGNPALSLMLTGDPQVDLSGERISGLYADPAVRTSLIEALEATGQVKGWEGALVTFDGRHIRVRGTSTLKRNDLGETTHIDGVLEDITEQRRFEEQHRLIVETAEEGIWMADVAGRILFANPKLAEMLDVGAEDLLDELVHKLAHPDDRPALLAGLERAHGGQGDRIPVRLQRSDGSTISTVVAATPYTERGRVTGSLAMITDITDQKRYEAQLERALDSKDEMIASVSHELRTPLTAIVGFAEVLGLDRADLGEEARVMLDTIAEQAQEMAYIVEDLLVATRTDEDAIGLELASLRPADTVESTLQSLDLGATVEVEVRTHRSLVADRVRFIQIVRNLLTNADRYGGPAVRIVVDEAPGGVAVKVMDDGSGIDTELTESVFDPYVRSAQTRGLPGSMGLGLAVAKRLTHLMNGELTYRRDGGWTVFEVILPAAGPAVPADPVPVGV